MQHQYQHDYKPTHSFPPAEYSAACEAADNAWAAYYEYTDQVFDGSDEPTPAEWSQLKVLLAAANAAEEAKAAAYLEWMGEYDTTRSEPGEHIRNMVMVE